METQYIVVYNEKKRGSKAAEKVIELISEGGVIISAIGTQTAVHYVIGSMSDNPAIYDDEAQIIRDNLDTTHPENTSE